MDLSGSYFNVVYEPLAPGDLVNVDFSIYNSEANNSGGFYVDFYLSDNNYISTYDTYLGDYYVSDVSGFSDTGTLSTSFSLPESYEYPFSYYGVDDTYSIGMIIDSYDYVSETDEFNNSNTGEFDDYEDVYITGEDVNLSGSSFNVVYEPLASGDLVNVDFSVYNSEAGSSGGFYVDFYLSDNDYISEFDTRLSQYYVSGVSGFSDTGTLSTSFYLRESYEYPFSLYGDQTYYIGMIIDSYDYVIETNEFDNRNTGEWYDYDGVYIDVI